MGSISINIKQVFKAPELNDILEQQGLWQAVLAAERYIEGGLIGGDDYAQEFARLNSQALALSYIADDNQRAEALLDWFYADAGFYGNWQDFFVRDNLRLSQVIHSRAGMGVSMAILLLDFARQLDLDVSGVCYPGHFLLRFIFDDEAHFFDAFSAEWLDEHGLTWRLQGALGPHTPLDNKWLEPDDDDAVLERYLQAYKTIALHDHAHDIALRVSELLLALKPDDPYEIRDRGFVLQSLGCDKQAERDFAFFIEKCPSDPIAQGLKHGILDVQIQPTLLH